MRVVRQRHAYRLRHWSRDGVRHVSHVFVQTRRAQERRLESGRLQDFQLVTNIQMNRI